MRRVLIADDERPLLRALSMHLGGHGYEVDTVDTGAAAVDRGLRYAYDVVLVDVSLPDITGVDVVHALRGQSQLPIIVLSAWHDESWKIRALDAGADDYITKPFATGELLARMRAVMRRAHVREPDLPPVVTADFSIDLSTKRAMRADGSDVVLTPTQWQLVELLVRNPDRLVTQSEILGAVWGPAFARHGHYVRQHMAQIRRKFEPDPARPRYFLTQPGLGVRFVPALGIEIAVTSPGGRAPG